MIGDSQGIVIPEGGSFHEFLHVQNASPDPVLALARRSDRVRDVRVLQACDGEFICEMTMTGDCIAESLREMGVILQSATVEDGEARVTVVLPPERDPDAVVETIRDRYPSLSVVAVRERTVAIPLLTRRGFQRVLQNRLTERQWTVLRLAFVDGYFRRPRETSQRE
ncbi:MAG: bacterio-opsin activator domain-containing protein [bacterium]